MLRHTNDITTYTARTHAQAQHVVSLHYHAFKRSDFKGFLTANLKAQGL